MNCGVSPAVRTGIEPEGKSWKLEAGMYGPLGKARNFRAESIPKVVRTRGLEPPRLAAPDPKSGVSAIPPRAQRLFTGTYNLHLGKD